ncbi:MAG: FKBP-type peptidyl-prolyl cis-trans isomerase [Rubrivivax sp.]|nr:FKBP-type peptidyl-prolyl cis-trans isomerase [Rubrivivax sp.]
MKKSPACPSPLPALAFTRKARTLAIGLALALPLAVPHAQPTAASASAQDALAAAAAEKGAQVTASGLVYRSLQDGQGESPAAADTVRVHYRGRFPDGREFDSSYSRGQPTSFPLNRVIRCWTEGVQRMKVGGKAKLTCPAAIAYGERGAGGVIPPNAVLQFEVELLGITKAPG